MPGDLEKWDHGALMDTILGHANLRSTMIYAHVDRDPSVKAANRVADRISSAMRGVIDTTSPQRAEGAADLGSAQVGLLPTLEWQMLLDLNAVGPDEVGRLSARNHEVMQRLVRHGFAEEARLLNDDLAWWRITPLGQAVLRAAKDTPMAA